MTRQYPDEVERFSRTQGVVSMTGSKQVRFSSVSDFKYDRSQFQGLRFTTALLDAVDLYPEMADDIAGFLRMTCRVERVITTSAVR